MENVTIRFRYIDIGKKNFNMLLRIGKIYTHTLFFSFLFLSLSHPYTYILYIQDTHIHAYIFCYLYIHYQRKKFAKMHINLLAMIISYE